MPCGVPLLFRLWFTTRSLCPPPQWRTEHGGGSTDVERHPRRMSDEWMGTRVATRARHGGGWCARAVSADRLGVNRSSRQRAAGTCRGKWRISLRMRTCRGYGELGTLWRAVLCGLDTEVCRDATRDVVASRSAEAWMRQWRRHLQASCCHLNQACGLLKQTSITLWEQEKTNWSAVVEQLYSGLWFIHPPFFS